MGLGLGGGSAVAMARKVPAAGEGGGVDNFPSASAGKRTNGSVARTYGYRYLYLVRTAGASRRRRNCVDDHAHADEVRRVHRGCFEHELPAVYRDCLDRDAQRHRDLLVRLPADDQVEHFTFAVGEIGEALLDGL